ncbi:MAG: FAD-binding oxidoreductase [Fimbriimonas sp.]|jgi:glycolate oxidase
MDFSQLHHLLKPDQILTGAAAMRGYDCDAYTVDRSAPAVVVLPESTQEVAAVVTWCHHNKVPFTARGAGTGLSGGALPALGGVVISTKRLTKILAVDAENHRLKAQTGIANRKISDEVQHLGLHFAPDPSSQSVATLGGNIAENAGGPHTLKYGVTVQHILGLTTVLPNGEIVEFGNLTGHEPGFDWLGILCGSEGTLGIVTEAWVKLTPLPLHVATALISFPSIRSATECVASIIANGVLPAALEMMDKGIMDAVREAFNLQFHPDSLALLLVECDGAIQDQVEVELKTIQQVCEQFGCIETTIAANEKERAKLWMARKKGVGAMGRLAPTIVTHDCVIPRSKLPEMLDFVNAVGAKHGLGVANIFHAGDGNLHPFFYFDDREPGVIKKVVEAGEEIIRKCITLGGSITGEHGVGVEKLDAMPLMFTPDDLNYQFKLKAVFDPESTCNPCKVLPNQKSCNEHRQRWRGTAW